MKLIVEKYIIILNIKKLSIILSGQKYSSIYHAGANNT